jgi:hypothetical protein
VANFESMSDDEFNKHLCGPVQLLDQIVRAQGYDTVPDYRKQLVEYDRICMEPVQDEKIGYAYIHIPYEGLE